MQSSLRLLRNRDHAASLEPEYLSNLHEVLGYERDVGSSPLAINHLPSILLS